MVGHDEPCKPQINIARETNYSNPYCQLPRKLSPVSSWPSNWSSAQKTLSLESAGSGGQDMEKLETSSMGTSTALAMQATPTEMVYENIVSLIKGPLVNINKDV